MKKLSLSLVKLIENDLNEKVLKSFISHVSIISNEDILLEFSFYKKEKLFISLNHFSPFCCLCDIKEKLHTLEGHINETLRKMLLGAYIYQVRQKENDRVITFTLHKTNDLFEKQTFFLVLELIPHRSNLLLLDEEKKIIFATHYTSLNVSRPIIKGLTYEELESVSHINEEKEDLESYKKECLNYFEEAKNQRRKDQYSFLFTSVKNKIKSLEKKLIILENGIKEATNQLEYKDYGNLLYTVSDESMIQEYLNDGLLKDYDLSLNLKENAQRYFKKYKKAKSTIEHNKEEILKAKEDIIYYQRIYTQLENGDDEDLEELKESLHLLKGQKAKVNKGRNKKKRKISPLFINFKGTKIIFGKTDAQNEIVTFEKAQPFDYFFHIANYSGSHVVILKDNPSDEEKLIASEIALLLSKKEDGDVQMTQVKNVKKSHSVGNVQLKSYSIIHLNTVRDSTKDLLVTAQRM